MRRSSKAAGSKKSERTRGTPKTSEASIVESNLADRRFRVVAGLEELLVPVGSLVEDPANARRHPERNLEAIKASLSTRGQHAPLVVQAKGRVVRVGNGRLRAARALGWSHVAAIVVDEDDVAASARAIADNRAAELAEWDGENLVAVMAELQAAGATGLGFEADEIAHIRGEFAAPGNGAEVFGSVADGLVVRGSIVVQCRKEDAQVVEGKLREAVTGPDREGWSVRPKAKQKVEDVARKRRAKVDQARERERAAAGASN